MSITYLDTSKLKALGLANGRRIDSTYELGDDGKAYDYATRRVGYENPSSVADEDYATKQYWLIELMNLYFYHDQLRKHTPKFDVEGLKLSQVAKGLRELIKDIEAAFAAAREATTTAHLFIEADDLFTNIVDPHGLIDDAVGQDYRDDEEE